MVEFLKNISFAELAIYLGGCIIWFGLISWLHEEELEDNRQKRFGKTEVRSYEK